MDHETVEITVTDGELAGRYRIPTAELARYRADGDDVEGFTSSLRLLATVAHMQAQAAAVEKIASDAEKAKRKARKAVE